MAAPDRIALISDLHGNTLALDAVLADIESQGGADQIWALGDLVALGPDPVGVVQRLRSLPNCSAISGNTERYTLTGCRPLPTPDQSASREHLAGHIAGFSWTAGRLLAGGELDWIADLPSHVRGELADGTRVVGCHATYDRDDGAGLHNELSDDELDGMLRRAEADILVGGHTHTPMLRTTSAGTTVNLGSVSNPTHLDPRATYAIVRSGRPATVEHRSVEYDYERVLAELVRLRHPGVGFIEEHYFRVAGSV